MHDRIEHLRRWDTHRTSRIHRAAVSARPAGALRAAPPDRHGADDPFALPSTEHPPARSSSSQ